jgi:hypothetical protein
MYTFYKDVLLGYDAEYFTGDNELLAHLIIDAIRFIPLEHEDEQCEFVVGLRVNAELLLALIHEGDERGTLRIGTKWILRIAWAYAKGSNVEDNSSHTYYDSMFTEFIGYVALLFNGDTLLVTEDSEFKTLRLIIYSLYEHLIGLSSAKIMEYVGMLFYNILNHLTTPTFSFLSKMIRIYNHCNEQKKEQIEFNLHVKELIKAIIKASGRDLTFIDFEGSYRDMNHDLIKVGLSPDDIDNLKNLISKNTPLNTKTGEILNDYEKGSPSNKGRQKHSSSSNKIDTRRGLPSVRIKNSSTDDDSSDEENSHCDDDSDFSDSSSKPSSISSSSSDSETASASNNSGSSNDSRTKSKKRKKETNKVLYNFISYYI